MIIILSFLILSAFVYFKLTDSEKFLKKEIELPQIEEKTKEKFSGIFEVHITVNPKDNYVNLIDYTVNTPTDFKVKPVFAVSQSKNNQYMLSYFTKTRSAGSGSVGAQSELDPAKAGSDFKDTEIDVIREAKNVANNLLENNIEVIRVKVEGHNLTNTPQTDEQFFSTKRYLLNHYGGEDPYFEFHVKINKWNSFKTRSAESGSVGASSDFKNIEEDIKGIDTLNQVGISYNLFSKNLKPLLTIRVYNNGFIEACKYKDRILNKMRNKGYVFELKIQQEFILYDSNPELDKGWLY